MLLPPVHDLEVVMSFAASLASVFRKYAIFSGRARRSELWWYVLAYEVVLTVLNGYFISRAFAGIDANATPQEIGSALGSAMFVPSIVSLALLLPTLAVIVRRLHDLNKSGFWYFFGLVPVVGVIMLIVWLATAGTVGANRFGADPKAAAAPADVPVAA